MKTNRGTQLTAAEPGGRGQPVLFVLEQLLLVSLVPLPLHPLKVRPSMDPQASPHDTTPDNSPFVQYTARETPQTAAVAAGRGQPVLPGLVQLVSPPRQPFRRCQYERRSACDDDGVQVNSSAGQDVESAKGSPRRHCNMYVLSHAGTETGRRRGERQSTPPPRETCIGPQRRA